jgi:hydroxyacylglutathione hydrolase
MLRVQCFTFNAFEENTYIVYDDTGACSVIDPGCYAQQEQEALSTFIEENALQVIHLVSTHAHIDHVVGNHYIKANYGVSLALHEQEVPTLHTAEQYAAMYGFAAYRPIEQEKLLTAGDTIQLGSESLSVLHVPGHSPGHIALYSPKNKLCLCGDVLFKNSVGRTDLPGGDHTLLLQSIRQQLFLLGDDTVIYPGHGPTTTIGAEKKNNIFCQI